MATSRAAGQTHARSAYHPRPSQGRSQRHKNAMQRTFFLRSAATFLYRWSFRPSSQVPVHHETRACCVCPLSPYFLCVEHVRYYTDHTYVQRTNSIAVCKDPEERRAVHLVHAITSAHRAPMNVHAAAHAPGKWLTRWNSCRPANSAAEKMWPQHTFQCLPCAMPSTCHHMQQLEPSGSVTAT